LVVRAFSPSAAAWTGNGPGAPFLGLNGHPTLKSAKLITSHAKMTPRNVNGSNFSPKNKCFKNLANFLPTGYEKSTPTKYYYAI